MTPSRRTLRALALAFVLAAVTAPAAGAGTPGGGGAVAPTGATGASPAGRVATAPRRPDLDQRATTTTSTTTTRTSTSRTTTSKDADAEVRPRSSKPKSKPGRARTTSHAARADPPPRALLQGPRDRLQPQPADGPDDRRARPARPLPHAGLLGVLPARAAGAATPRASPLGARVRPTGHGLVVTIPAGAATGRIFARRAARVALEALRPDQGPRGAGAAGAAGGPAPVRRTPATSAFDAARDVDLVPERVRRRQPGEHRGAGAGGRHHDALRQELGRRLELLVAVHAGARRAGSRLGLQICAWQYVYGNDPVGEADSGSEAVEDGADCLVIDAEDEYGGKYAAAQTYIDTLRAGVGAGLSGRPRLVALRRLPRVGALFRVPRARWRPVQRAAGLLEGDRHEPRRGVRPHLHREPDLRPLARPPRPVLRLRLGGRASSASARSPRAYGAPGVSWWDWQSSTASMWPALTPPLAPTGADHGRRRGPLLTQGLARRPGPVDAGVPRLGRAADPDQRDLRRDERHRPRGLPGRARPPGERRHRRRDLAALLALTPVAVTLDLAAAGPTGPTWRDRRRTGSSGRDRCNRVGRTGRPAPGAPPA